MQKASYRHKKYPWKDFCWHNIHLCDVGEATWFSQMLKLCNSCHLLHFLLSLYYLFIDMVLSASEVSAAFSADFCCFWSAAFADEFLPVLRFIQHSTLDAWVFSLVMGAGLEIVKILLLRIALQLVFVCLLR